MRNHFRTLFAAVAILLSTQAIFAADNIFDPTRDPAKDLAAAEAQAKAPGAICSIAHCMRTPI